jgi:hypothetical protein
MKDFGIRAIIAVGFILAGDIETVDIFSWAFYLGLFVSCWLLLSVYGKPRREEL